MTIKPTDEMILALYDALPTGLQIPGSYSFEEMGEWVKPLLAEVEASLVRAVEEGGSVLYDDRTVIGKAYQRGFNDGSLDAERAAEVRES